jgi:hypothetical protein
MQDKIYLHFLVVVVLLIVGTFPSLATSFALPFSILITFLPLSFSISLSSCHSWHFSLFTFSLFHSVLSLRLYYKRTKQHRNMAHGGTRMLVRVRLPRSTKLPPPLRMEFLRPGKIR